MIFQDNIEVLAQLSQLGNKAEIASAMSLRSLIVDTARELQVPKLTESLKWGQPSYQCNHGTTLRVGLVNNKTDCIALYFHCQSKLAETFRELYCNELEIAGKRAIILPSDMPLKETQISALRHCVSLALQYHKIKHLPLLGC